jgi:hypothetical protein
MATTIAGMSRAGRARTIRETIAGRAGITRRHLQIAVGLVWLVDAALQAQPFMFTRGFATQVIASGAQGQPSFVSVPVNWVASMIAAHPFAWNVPFVAVQLLLGVGLLVRRTARPALAVSIAWALGVWYFGEGLSGLAGGHASLVTGAPGSAALLAVLAAAAWPTPDGSRSGPAPWLPFAWAVVWVGGAVFQSLPQNSGEAVGWLVAAEYVVGVGALTAPTRVPAAATGLVLALVFWVVGQDLGQLSSGKATDPNSGPLLALMAMALISGRGFARTR